MNERQAREVTLLEAFETVRPPAAAWTDDDRAWADRVALEAAGGDLAPAGFVALRAGHALQRLGTREPRLVGWLARPAAFGRWLLAVGVAAFVVGLVLDRLDPAQRINLLALPFLGVVAWNLAVYVLALGLGLVAPLRRGDARRAPRAGRLRRLLAIDAPPAALARLAEGRVGLQYAALWPARHGRVTGLRVQAVLHAGAAALALGLVAGLYLRGLVHDYRVNWESTFLSPAAAHAVVTTLLAPASWLSGLALPDVAAFATLRAAQGDRSTGAPAADWIHLLALTLMLLVVLPRVLLGALAFGVARWRAGRIPLPLDDPYFGRIVRLRRAAGASVQVFPYARTPSARGALALRDLVVRAFGARVGFEVAPTVAFDAQDDAALVPAPATTHAIALFDLGATPEGESQGRFVEQLAAALPGGAGLAVVVDEGPFRARFAGLPERLAQRQAAWREWGATLRLEPVFADLEAGPGAGASAAALEAGFTDAAAVARA
jgi:hypothetical protein